MESFRSEVKIWLQENCPEGVRGPAREEDTVWGGRDLFGQVKMLDFGYKQWAKRLDLPNLAEKYGGGGLSHEENDSSTRTSTTER